MCVALLVTLSLPRAAAAQEGRGAQDDDYVTNDGDQVAFDRAWSAYKKLGPWRRAHAARAAYEELFALAAGGVWYWASHDLNSTDWDIPPTAQAIFDRFRNLDYVRFDTNRFFVNQGHILAGTGYYLLARSNDMGPALSLLYAFATSTTWEWVVEFREKPSINDLITSPLGGEALGEALYQLGEVYHRGGNLPLAARVLTAPFSVPRAVHRWLDDAPPDPVLPKFGPPLAHTFRLRVGGGARNGPDDATRPIGSIALSTRVAAMPGYQHPGRFSTGFANGNFTALDLDLRLGSEGIEATTAQARAIMFGYYRQRIDPGPRGYDLTIGAARGVRVVYSDVDGLHDRIGIVDLIGPALTFDTFDGDLHLSAEVETFLDFGSVASAAFPQYAAAHGKEGVRSELEAEGYYFAWGGTIVSNVSLSYRPVSIGADMRFAQFSQIGGFDRFHGNDVPTKVDLDDRRLAFEGWARLDVTPSLALQARYGAYRLDSSLDEFSSSRRFREYTGSLQYTF